MIPYPTMDAKRSKYTRTQYSRIKCRQPTLMDNIDRLYNTLDDVFDDRSNIAN